MNLVYKTLESIFLLIVIYLNSLGLNFYEINNNTVVKVTDGDTIEVFIDNKVEKVRLIGINTPETIDPKREVECFGLEASYKLKETLTGKVVTLEADSSQDNIDKFGRLLRYVYLDDKNINQQMIEEGYAFEYTYKIPYKLQNNFRQSQKDAKSRNLGLWNKEVCDY